jgi:hypothetical protein
VEEVASLHVVSVYNVSNRCLCAEMWANWMLSLYCSGAFSVIVKLLIIFNVILYQKDFTCITPAFLQQIMMDNANERLQNGLSISTAVVPILVSH